jgi:hypothetical protein
MSTMTKFLKINALYFLYVMICFCVSYVFYWLFDLPWSGQVFKDVLLYAIVWKVMAMDVENG